MGESPKFERPTTPEEEHELTLERSKYLLEHIAEQNKKIDTDELTGLKKREVLMDELENALTFIRGDVAEHNRSGERIKEVSLLFIDLDNFKRVNDTHGHFEGDAALQSVAEVLRASVRESDVVSRFGGDEFYILLPRVTAADAEVVGNKILGNITKNQKLRELGIGASIGVSSSDLSTDASELVHFADLAAAKAKQDGKNQVVVYTGSTEPEAANA